MKNSGIPIDSLPPHVRAQVLAQLGGPGARKNASPRPLLQKDGTTDAPGARLRQNGKGPNKTEAAFEAHLRASPVGEGREILVQAVTLLIANGCRYTPDLFLTPSWRGHKNLVTPIAYEVKGYMREDAAVKIKVAARAYPWILFRLVTKRRKKAGGGWSVQDILP